jgi:hypothetical protein
MQEIVCWQEVVLQPHEKLEQILPVGASPFISYLRSIRELHIICITSEFTEAAWKMALFNFEQNFFFLYEVYQLNMTLKIHIILTHYKIFLRKWGSILKKQMESLEKLSILQ